MTTPDIAGLCERLRAEEIDPFGHGGRTLVSQPNPDGPEAADTLERQAAEIERLRGKMKGLLRDCLASDFNECWDSYTEARAALTGED